MQRIMGSIGSLNTPTLNKIIIIIIIKHHAKQKWVDAGQCKVRGSSVLLTYALNTDKAFITFYVFHQQSLIIPKFWSN